jgi:hypothetical protein
MAKTVTPSSLMTENQAINNLDVSKIDKNCNKLQKDEAFGNNGRDCSSIIIHYGIHEPFGVLHSVQNHKSKATSILDILYSILLAF